jgi:sugar phosphate isomerase/epimerase
MIPRPTLAVSLAGLERDSGAPWAAGARAAIDWAAGAGFRAVQLDAAAAGVRGRDLDRSGRRDLAALLRRSQLALAGLDLWVPPEHFADPARSERAVAALTGAIELAADLARLVEGSPQAAVSVVLPAALDDEIRAAIEGAAQSRGTRLADHACHVGKADAPRSQPAPEAPLGIGIDPAALLLAGQDPAVAAAKAGAALVSARLSDASLVGRAPAGTGRLDETAYLASLSVAGYGRPLVLDLRGVANQDAAARSALARW